MASITSWTRLEPTTRDPTFEVGLTARLHDPLWTLARQWQLGEFQGEDNGSPVEVTVRADVSPLSRLWLGADPTTTAGRPYDPGLQPLETAIEYEPMLVSASAPTAGSEDLEQRFRAGLHFLRLIEQAGVGRYRQAFIDRYALIARPDDDELDAVSKGLLRLYGSRTPDGLLLGRDLRQLFPDSLPAVPRIRSSDRAAMFDVVERWLSWFDKLYGRSDDDTESAWHPERMEYRVTVGFETPTGRHLLEADEHVGGHLDWYAFDHRDSNSVGLDETGQHQETVHTAVPVPVEFRGMPAARWWEFEDSAVNLAQVDAGGDDLLRILLLDFAIRFGNDWFTVPFEVDVGALCRISSVVVRDAFGHDLLIDHSHQVDLPRTDWRLFALAPPDGIGRPGDTNRSDGPERSEHRGLFIAPTLAAGLESEPLESIHLLRDEMSNMAWAVERIVQAPSGRAWRRDEAMPNGDSADDSEPAENQSVVVEAGSTPYRYRLATTPPQNWIPLLPERIPGAGPSIRLRRGRLLRRDGTTLPEPRGRLLRPDDELSLFEEEVPRAGARVVRRVQHARWIDGSSHTWIGRHKLLGAVERSSGLRFDALIPPNEQLRSAE